MNKRLRPVLLIVAGLSILAFILLQDAALDFELQQWNAAARERIAEQSQVFYVTTDRNDAFGARLSSPSEVLVGEETEIRLKLTVIQNLPEEEAEIVQLQRLPNPETEPSEEAEDTFQGIVVRMKVEGGGVKPSSPQPIESGRELEWTVIPVGDFEYRFRFEEPTAADERNVHVLAETPARLIPMPSPPIHLVHISTREMNARFVAFLCAIVLASTGFIGLLKTRQM